MGKHDELATLLSGTPLRATFRKFLEASHAPSTVRAYREPAASWGKLATPKPSTIFARFPCG